MNEFIYHNSHKAKGPLVVERARIDELAQTLSSEWGRLHQYWEDTVEERVQTLLKERPRQFSDLPDDDAKAAAARQEVLEKTFRSPKLTRKVTMELEGERSVTGATIEDILRRPEVQDTRVLAISIDWEVVDVALDFDLAGR